MRALAILIVVMWSGVAYSDLDPGAFYISPKLAVKRIDIDANVLPATFTNDTNYILGLDVTAGYRTPIGFLFEVGVGYAENVGAFGSTFDNYELTEKRIALGYSIPLSDRVRLVPKYGIYAWRLKGEEGQFLNSGPEESAAFKEEDKFFQVDVETMFTSWIGLDLSLLYSSTQFGLVRSYSIGVQFEL